MNAKTEMKFKIFAVGTSLAMVVVAMGFGCGVGLESASFIGHNSGFSSFSGPSDSGDNGNLSIVSGTKTVAVTNYNTVLDAMTSMTNVQPSATTRNLFNDRLGSFSEFGNANSVNAPMLFAYVTVGAEVCDDLIDAEAALPATSRRFFVNINLGGGNTFPTMTDENINDMIKRMARQFWQREETPEELTLLNAGVKEVLAGRPSNTSGLARQGVLAGCTAMIASTSSYEL